MKKGILLFVILLWIISPSLAFSGVSPGTYSVDFEPGAERIFVFTFLGDVDSNFEVYAEGDLEQYITLKVDELKGGGEVVVLLEFPQNIEIPGTHVIYIGAKESSSDSGISVVANVKGQIMVNVPFPGKYATMNYEVENARAKEDVKMNIILSNLGNEEVNFVGKINIYDEKSKLIETLELGEYNIPIHEKEEIEYLFDTKPYPAGKYQAEAVFEYESGILSDKKPFRLGELIINIIWATRNLNRDTINQFDVTVESLWNDPIENVYAEVNLFGQNIKFTTPSVVLSGFQTTNLTGFFDTTGITDDSFNVNVRVFYEGKFSERFVKLSFKKEINYILIGGIVVVSIFILIVIVLIVIAIKLRRIKDEIGKRKKK